MARMATAKRTIRVNRLQSHLVHQSVDPFTIDPESPAAQYRRHPSDPVERCCCVLTVNQVHQRQIQRTVAAWLIVDVASVESQQFALATDGNLSVIVID